MRAQAETAISDPRLQRAFRFISENENHIESDQIRLTAIPAPPFQEGERALAFEDELRKRGWHPRIDDIGNVIAAYETIGRNPVIVAAHLDTVFPLETSLEIRRKGKNIFIPGISDNGCGIVALLWAFRAAKEAGIRFRRPVLAVGTVGEEGEGNLRGVRRLFENPCWGSRECEFIAVDGAGLNQITHRGLGSRRYRIVMRGPGGHSWADFGRPNPVQLMASAIHTFSATAKTSRSATAFNFGVIRGGISVNAIPSEVLAEVDLRSVAGSDLEELDDLLRRTVNEITRAGRVQTRFEKIGDRPAGTTPPESTIVQTALEATRAFGVEARLGVGSTDANIPISMGIPAIALGGGGASANIHTPEEWFDPSHRELGVQRLLTLVSMLAGLA